MHLIVGLGNPGAAYQGTRHNAGFEAVDSLAAKHRFAPFKLRSAAFISHGTLGDAPVVLCKPQTFMNLSGSAAGAIARFYKIAVRDMVVIHDELDFAVGRVQLKAGGGHGGHNGLRSLMAHMGGEFARVRLGVGKPSHSAQGASWVLSRYGTEDRISMDQALVLACEAATCIVQHGIDRAMNLLNGAH